MKYLIMLLILVSCGDDDVYSYPAATFEVNKCYRNVSIPESIPFKVIKVMDFNEIDEDDEEEHSKTYVFKTTEEDWEYLTSELKDYSYNVDYVEVDCTELGL